MIPVTDVLQAVQTYGEPELVQLLDGLGPVLSKVPLDALLRMGEAAAAAAKASTELAAMRAAVAGADAAADAVEETTLAKNAKT